MSKTAFTTRGGLGKVNFWLSLVLKLLQTPTFDIDPY